MLETAKGFFGSVTRVVSVVFYSEPLSWQDGTTKQVQLFKEVVNTRNKFDGEYDWKLLRYQPRSGHWNSLPEKWVRLIDFPTHIGEHG